MQEASALGSKVIDGVSSTVRHSLEKAIAMDLPTPFYTIITVVSDRFFIPLDKSRPVTVHSHVRYSVSNPSKTDYPFEAATSIQRLASHCPTRIYRTCTYH